MGKASRGKWERRLQWAMQQRTPKLTSWGRFLSYAENNLSLAAIGLLGGVGTFFYGPILCFCVLLFVLGLHRSPALDGLSKRVQAFWYVAVLLVSGTGLYEMGHFIESHKEHPPTAKEIWEGHTTPAPLPPVINNTYQTTIAPSPKSPLIDMGEPYPSQNQGEPYFTFDKTNIGDQLARRVVNTPGVYVLPVSRKSEEQIFRDLYDKDAIITDADAVADEGVGIEHRSHVNFPAHFSPEDMVKLQDKKNGAYIVMLVTYSDSRGIRHSSESCWIYSPLFPALGTCSRHNGAK